MSRDQPPTTDEILERIANAIEQLVAAVQEQTDVMREYDEDTETQDVDGPDWKN